MRGRVPFVQQSVGPCAAVGHLYRQVEPFSGRWGLGPASKLLGLGSQYSLGILGHSQDVGALGRLEASSQPLGLGI